jgi:hypothetical protein
MKKRDQDQAQAIKKLEEYRQTHPEQMLLFQLTSSSPEARRYSNTIELYDAIPKYHWGNAERIQGEFLRNLDREFEHRGTRYRVTISPAKIRARNGKEKDYYPSQREELVEDALRKLACDGKGVFLDDQAGVVFSLYELQRELESMGHGYNIAEIKDALMICAKASLELTNEEGTAVVVSNLFETLGLQTREDRKNGGAKSKSFVRFNMLVTLSIKNQTFRRINYEKCMAYRSVIARRLHKRMSHYYTQASMAHPYTILLSTIIRDFGIKEYDQIRVNLFKVQEALEEMKDQEVINDYKVEKIYSKERKNKIVDAKFTIFPHLSFVQEMVNSNAQQKRLREVPTTTKRLPR